jgi:cytochrome b subunit of formate dehydrogenase
MKSDFTRFVRSAFSAFAALTIASAVLKAAEETAPANLVAAQTAPQNPLQGQPKASPIVANSECMDCHEAEFKARKKGMQPEWIGVKPEVFAHSAHGNLNCVDCHTSIVETPHESKLPPVQCASCHEKDLPKHAFHPRIAANPMPAGTDTSCTGCHGAHDTIPVKDKQFAFTDGKQTEACGRCHEAASRAYAASAHGARPARARQLTLDCLTCHDLHVTAGSKPAGVELKLAQARLCESCHVKKAEVADQSLLGAKFVSSFDQSVHGAALAAGHENSATCIDCHGAHAMNSAAVAGARINRLHIPETCARCHEKQAFEFNTSVHAAALAKGNLDAPVCTDCHGEHDIRKHTDPSSPVHDTNLAQQVCAECHASVRLTTKYGLRSDTFKTFTDSYHGLADRGGSVEVVNCASCHGVHAIKSQNDPTSSVYKGNLAKTCGECHRGANKRFAIGAVHASSSRRDTSSLLYWIATLYTGLIIVVVGGMALHNLLDFLKKTRRKLAIQKGEIQEHPVAHRLYLRMSLNERLQHSVLVVSFVMLVVTGFMLRYPEAWWVVAIRQFSSRAFDLRSLVHRAAGVIMLSAGVWHACYLAFTKPGRKLFRDLLPRWRDLTDPWYVFKYNIGISPDKPAFGRFCYIEKAEYWALVWGTLLMGVTGAILWFENASMGWITKLGFDAARSVHFYEAILATLAIVVWHLYFVIFNPDVYPMNLAWLTGRMSEQEMIDEHPLQLEQLKAQERTAADTPETADPAVPPKDLEEKSGEDPPNGDGGG